MITEFPPDNATTFTRADMNITDRSPAIENLTTGDIIYIIVGIIGVIDNAFATTVLAASKSLRRSMSTTFLINQSIVDFISSVLLIASYDTNKARAITDGTWTLAGELYCQLWAGRMFMWGFMMISTYNLIMLTLERYCMVVHPIWHRMTITRRKAIIGIAINWVACMIYNYIFNGLSTPLVDGICPLYTRWISKAAQKTMGVLTYILEMIVPVLVMSYCYTKMVLVMRSKVAPKSRNKNQPSTKGEKEGAETEAAEETSAKKGKTTEARISKNMMKTLIMVCACFFLCWVCNQTLFFLVTLGLDIDLTSALYDFTIACALVNSCINPLIYVFQYKHFRLEAMRIFCGRKTSAEVDELSRTVSVTTA